MPEANKNHGMDKSRPPRYFRPQIDVAGEDAVRALASGKAGSLALGRRRGGARPKTMTTAPDDGAEVVGVGRQRIVG